MKERLVNLYKTYLYRKDMDKLRKSFFRADRLMSYEFKKKNLRKEMSSKELLVLKALQLNIIQCIDKNKENVKSVKGKEKQFWE